MHLSLCPVCCLLCEFSLPMGEYNALLNFCLFQKLQMHIILSWSLLVPICAFLSYPYYPGVIFWISCWKLERIEVVLAFEWIHRGPEPIEWSVKTNKHICNCSEHLVFLWRKWQFVQVLCNWRTSGNWRTVQKGCFFLNSMGMVKKLTSR